MQDNTRDESVRVDRRGMLRKAGIVVAGAAGATVASAVAATPAQAAPGDPVAQGAANDAGIEGTSLTANTASEATLQLGNTAYTDDGAGGIGGASLALAQNPALYMNDTVPGGGLMQAVDGMVMYAPVLGGTTYPNQHLFSSVHSTFTLPCKPYRALDTRNNRSRLFGTSGALDSSGRLLAGKTVHLDISDLGQVCAGVFFSVSAVAPLATGHIKVWPYGQPLPTTTVLNYQSGQGATTGALAAVGQHATDLNKTDILSIWTYRTTHVVIDITGVIFQHIDQAWASSLQFPFIGTAGAQGADSTQRQRADILAAKLKEWSKQSKRAQ